MFRIKYPDTLGTIRARYFELDMQFSTKMQFSRSKIFNIRFLNLWKRGGEGNVLYFHFNYDVSETVS